MQYVLVQVHKDEDDKYVETKDQLRRDISELREKVLAMISSNDGLPDIEQLERHEFILDMEDHQRLQEEEDAQIQTVGIPAVPPYT